MTLYDSDSLIMQSRRAGRCGIGVGEGVCRRIGRLRRIVMA